MSAGDDSAPPRPSVLTDFSAVPDRAMRDRRMTVCHHRVLLALVRSVDTANGCVLIGQRLLAKCAQVSRGKISAYLRDLESWGYIERLDRGRHRAGLRKGQRRTMMYRIIYEPAPAKACHPLRVTSPPEPVTHSGCRTLSPTAGDESRVLEKKKDTLEKEREGATSIFRALREADRFDDNVEVSRQLEMAFPEVARFNDLRRLAIKKHTFPKVMRLDLAIKCRHRDDLPGYVRALTAELEKLVDEGPDDPGGSVTRTEGA